MVFNGKSRIPLYDAVTGAQRPVIPDPAVLWSSGANWRSVVAEAYQVENLDTPEFQAPENHNVVLHLRRRAYVEQRVSNLFDSRVRVPGDLAIYPAGTPRQIKAPEPHAALVVSLSRKMWLQSAFDLHMQDPQLLRPWLYLRDSQIEHICRAFKAEAESGYISGPLYGDWLALAMAARLARLDSPADRQNAMRGGLAPRTLARVTDYIRANLSKPLNMDSLAKTCGLSQYRFAHNFKAATGLAPHQYVIRTRIEAATQLLREPDLSILEIAMQLGYRSTGQFSALFRRKTGVLPSQYRASLN